MTVHPPGPPEHPLDELAVYAVGALEDHERRAVEDHLAACPRCRAELAAHHETLAQLTPDEPAPAGGWDRISAAIGTPSAGDRDGSEVGGPRAGRRPRRDGDGPTEPAHLSRARAERWWRRPGPGLAAAVAAAVAIIAGSAILLAGRDEGPRDIDALAQAALADEDASITTFRAPGGGDAAQLVVDDSGTFLVFAGLEPLPEGRAYQLWSTDGPAPVSLGVVGDGSRAVAVEVPPSARELALSEEPASGVPVPTGDIVATGSRSGA